MPVSDLTVVDGIGIDKQSGVLLMHMWESCGWDDPMTQLRDLEKKVEAYVQFISSDQLGSHPEFLGRAVEIQVFFQHVPPKDANVMLRRVRERLATRGIQFKAFHGPDMQSPAIDLR